MFKWLKNIGNTGAEAIKEAEIVLKEVNSFEGAISALTDSELRAKTDEFKKRLLEGEELEKVLPEAYAVVRETAKRVRNERHFDVQIIGGVILNNRGIAEMRTGEGKTLVATLPAYLNALLGKGVHVVTVNDYLSRRDAVWMGEIYNFLGLSVGVLNHDASYLYDKSATTKEEDEERDTLGSFKVVHDFLRPTSRKEAYLADITYGTNSEFGFDYLRDNLEYEAEALRQREPHCAVSGLH
jgi:preprotein translocase subunit SecA